MAVSSLECGFLPMTQTAMRFTTVGYHEYESVAVDLAEQERLVADLGTSDLMVLRNHGLLVVGPNHPAGLQQHLPRRAGLQAQLLALAANSKMICPRPRSSRRPTISTAPKCGARSGSSNGRRCCASSTGSTRPIATNRKRAAGPTPWPTIVETLAAYVAAPADVVHHAKRALIDWFAAMLPGSQLAPATLLTAALEDETGTGRAWVYAGKCRAPLRTAALINAAASHTIEFDDIFRDAIYHPGCPVIGAALAAAQARGADGMTLLRAIVAGYEVSTRIGVAGAAVALPLLAHDGHDRHLRRGPPRWQA